MAEGVLSVDHPDSPLSSNEPYPLNPGETEAIPEDGPVYTLNRRMEFATSARPPDSTLGSAVAAPGSPASAESEASVVEAACGESDAAAGDEKTNSNNDINDDNDNSDSDDGGGGGGGLEEGGKAAARDRASTQVGNIPKGPNGEEVSSLALLADDAVGFEEVTETLIEPFKLDEGFDYDTVPYVENPYHVYGAQGRHPAPNMPE